MNAGTSYSVKEMFFWTLPDTIKIVLWASIPTIMFLCGIKWLVLPLELVSMVGVATSFIVGFRNSATYDRTWEARKIWGGIVNTSRSFAISINDFLHYNSNLNELEIAQAKKEIIYRHFAWLTALRHQLRVSKDWEAMRLPHNKAYQEKYYKVREWEVSMLEELKPYLTENELQQLNTKGNKASFLLSLQSNQLKDLLNSKNIDLFHQIDLQNRLYELYDHQGKSERIKNFPYPRQYTSISKYLVKIFVFILPFGLIGKFNIDTAYSSLYLLAAIPASSLIMWIFNTLERVGESSENPFEGAANDIPITNMSLNIENDCRDILGLERIEIPVSDSKIIM